MKPSKTPYPISIKETGGINVNLNLSAAKTHIDAEGYSISEESVTPSEATTVAISQQIQAQLKQHTPFNRFKREISTDLTKDTIQDISFTTWLVSFLALWTTFQVVIVPLVFGIGIESELWQSLFIFSSENPLYVWTWVTSIFSHAGYLHLFVNAVVIISFGYFVEDELSSMNFAVLFFASAILAGLVQIALVQQFAPQPMRMLGASGGAAALLGCTAVLYPKIRVSLFFIIPLKIVTAVVLFSVVSIGVVLVYGFGAGGIAHTAHITGLFIGLLYGGYHKRYNGLSEELLLRA